ncbi:MAG: hypothetical protein KDD44_03025, partial [Bdellovibrionales bacterium]|nr:hypothetical protein [Bdellovibrionales bacterium]
MLSPTARYPGSSTVHQLVPCLNYGDAVGNHALTLRSAFRANGAKSEIFTSIASDEYREHFLGLKGLVACSDPSSTVLYHH